MCQDYEPAEMHPVKGCQSLDDGFRIEPASDDMFDIQACKSIDQQLNYPHL
jgi:hypothetical protein